MSSPSFPTLERDRSPATALYLVQLYPTVLNDSAELFARAGIVFLFRHLRHIAACIAFEIIPACAENTTIIHAIVPAFRDHSRVCGEHLNETVIANASGDRDKGTRFARAPTSLEACTFCLMLANPHTPQEMKNAKEFAHYSKKQLVRRLEQSIAKRTTIDASPEGLPIGRPRTAFRPCPKRARGVLPTRAPLFPTTDRKLPGLPPR